MRNEWCKSHEFWGYTPGELWMVIDAHTPDEPAQKSDLTDVYEMYRAAKAEERMLLNE